MFRTIAAALIAASMLTAPALAQGTAPARPPAAAQSTKAPETKPAVKVVKAKKHFKRHAHRTM